MSKSLPLEKREECPLCNAQVYSRALHFMFCPVINKDRSVEELKVEEEEMSVKIREFGSKL